MVELLRQQISTGFLTAPFCSSGDNSAVDDGTAGWMAGGAGGGGGRDVVGILWESALGNEADGNRTGVLDDSFWMYIFLFQWFVYDQSWLVANVSAVTRAVILTSLILWWKENSKISLFICNHLSQKKWYCRFMSRFWDCGPLRKNTWSSESNQ